MCADRGSGEWLCDRRLVITYTFGVKRIRVQFGVVTNFETKNEGRIMANDPLKTEV